jgi:hypothetical protein
MLQDYLCRKCKRVSVFTIDDHSKCTTCGSTDIELLSREDVKKGFEDGVYWKIDLRTGGRAKPKRRR